MDWFSAIILWDTNNISEKCSVDFNSWTILKKRMEAPVQRICLQSSFTNFYTGQNY